jgi:hypothetical protein
MALTTYKAQGARHKVKEGEFRSQEPGDMKWNYIFSLLATGY